MMLIVAIINSYFESKIHDSLASKNISITKLASTGGFREKKSSTLVMGVEKERVEEAIKIIENVCKSDSALNEDEHGAVVFVLNAWGMYKY